LDVVIREGTAILKLLASEDQALLVGWDSFLVLDLGFDIVDGIRRLHLEGDGLARQGLHDCVVVNWVASFVDAENLQICILPAKRLDLNDCRSSRGL
jgi:hypothetical protein